MYQTDKQKSVKLWSGGMPPDNNNFIDKRVLFDM